MLDLTVPLVLASQSPRRRALLTQLGLTFTVVPSPHEELWPVGLSTDQAVKRLALDKAEAVAPEYRNALTLGADTVVVLDGSVLGKPADPHEAIRMLESLSGRTHTVYSGLALVHPVSERRVIDHVTTDVTFAPLSRNEIERYVAGGSPMDKAGAYGIQDDHGALFVEGIKGDYNNVVGLPLQRLYQLLRSSFSDLLAD